MPRGSFEPSYGFFLFTLSKLDRKSSLQLWKVVSKETAFGGGEHHTNGTRVDEEDRVPTNALARRLRRTEQGR
jgi:hypothetical protein